MPRYRDDLSLQEARALFFQNANLGGDGGYGNRWVRVESKPIPFYFPNWPARVASARLHDLHHIAAEYETDWPGEAEIAAWEIASGCGGHYAAWILNFGGFGAGIVLAPGRLFRAFLRGRQARTNLYKSGIDQSRLDQISVGELREQLGLRDPLTSARPSDFVWFILWSVPSILSWLPVPLFAVVVLWLIARVCF